MRKDKKNYAGIFLTIFLAFIMVSSIAGFLITDTAPAVKYKGTKFTATQYGWQAQYQGQKYLLSYTPGDVEYLTLPEIPKQLVEMDITSEFNSTFAQSISAAIFELSDAMLKRGVYIRFGITTNTTLPIITCADATPEIPLFYFTEGNKTGFSKEGSCIIASGRAETDFAVLADRIAYQVMGFYG